MCVIHADKRREISRHSTAYAESWKTVDDALQAALRHQQTPQQALDAASAKWQQLITDGYNGKT